MTMDYDLGASGGIGLDGEFRMEMANDQYVLLPPDDVPQQPGKKPVDEPKKYYAESTSSVSSGASGPVGDRVRVGTDPFGNPIYETIPYPVYREYYDLNPGWNTRASVPEAIGPTMYLSYKSGAAVGAIVGLTAAPETQAGYEDIIIGWMTLKGVAYIVSRGLVLLEVPVATSLPEPGSYNRDVDALTIKKTLNKVEFFLTSSSGQLGETKIGEEYITEEVTYVSAALYLGGDIINDEILEFPDVLAGEFRPLVGGFYESSTASYLVGSLPGTTGEFHENDNTVLSSEIPAMRGFFGDYANCFMWSDLPSVSGQFMSASDAEIVPDFNFTFSHIPPLAGTFMVRDMTFGTMDADLPFVSGTFADQPVSIMRGELPTMRGAFFEQEFADRLTLISFMYSRGQMVSKSTVYLVLNSLSEIVAAFTAESIEHMLLQSGASIDDTMALADIIFMLLSSSMSSSDVAALQSDGMSVWVLHMDSMGSTRYESYDFNSFMTIDGKTYGVNSTGIHELGGKTDGSDPIAASVDFGSLGFGANNRKALPYVYVGMAASGKTVLKVEAEGKTYYYQASDATAYMKTHRFELGRGLRSNFYGVSLTTDGEAFDLHNIEFKPVELKRSL